MDLRKIKQLLSLMESHELAEIEIVDENGSKVRLKKDAEGSREVAPPLATAPAAHAIPAAAAVPAPAAGEPVVPNGMLQVKSPMVGTFYRSPAPEADAFVTEGDDVDEDSVVCIIEAMKVMNEIKAEVTGRVTQILVESGEAVEYGQPLMLVKAPQSAG